MSRTEDRPFKLGDWEILPSRCTIQHDTRAVHVTPRAMDVLVHLSSREGEVVSNDELSEACWAPAVASDGSVQVKISELRKALGDKAKNSTYIQTIAGRGYRIVAPLERTAEHPTKPRPKSDPKRLPPPTVAVPQFKGIGNAPTLTAYAEGATLDLRTALGTTKTPLATDQDADYLVAGHVRASADAFAVTIELQDVRAHKVLWSEQLEDVGPTFTRAPYFAQRIESTMRILAEVQRSRTISEAARPEYLAARIEFSNWSTGAGGDPTVWSAHLQQALKYDPDYAAALSDMTNAYTGRLGGTITTEEAAPLAHATVRRLLELEPNRTFFLAKINLTIDLDYDAALRNYDHLLTRPEAEPYYAPTLQEMAFTHAVRGDREQSIACYERALSYPSDMSGMIRDSLAHAYLENGQYDAALPVYKATLNELGPKPIAPWAQIGIAECHFRLGNKEKANELLDSAWRTFSHQREVFPAVFALMGHRDRALEILTENERRFPNGARNWGSMVNASSFWGHYHLGNVDAALTWAERGIENRTIALITALKWSTEIDDLRNHPRFVAAMAHLLELESRGTPTHSIATRCYHGPNARPAALVSCARFTPP
jgi:DNA-binding winged helix-turn-helix (wHTH) protein/tetratricopeptide (TPR) repeat protein